MASASQAAESAVACTCSRLSTLSEPKRSLAADSMVVFSSASLTGPSSVSCPAATCARSDARRGRRDGRRRRRRAGVVVVKHDREHDQHEQRGRPAGENALGAHPGDATARCDAQTTRAARRRGRQSYGCDVSATAHPGRRDRHRRQPASCRTRRRRLLGGQPGRPGERAGADRAGRPRLVDRLGRASVGHAAEGLRPRRHAPDADRPQRARDRGLLRGLREPHALAALPRRGAAARVPARVVAELRRDQRALRRADREGGLAGTRRSGCTTTSCTWCRRCCARCGPTCASASSCTSRCRRRSCSCSCRGASRSSRACSAPTSSASSARSRRRTSCRSPAGSSTSTPTRTMIPYEGRTVRVGAFPVSIDFAEFDAIAALPETARRPPPSCAQALGSPAPDPARRRPARLHQGHRRPPAGLPRAARERRHDRGRDGARAGRDAEPRARRRPTASCASASSAPSGASTASSGASGTRRSTTSTTTFRARTSALCTRLPMSCS